MHVALQKIFHQFSGKINLQDTRIELLFEIAEKHPYFAPAQFFLALKMHNENHSNLATQLNKTALYFNNIHWLHYQLMPKPELIEFIEKEKANTFQPILSNVIKEEIEQHKTQLVISENVQQTYPENLQENMQVNVFENNHPTQEEVIIKNSFNNTEIIQEKEEQSIASIALNNTINETDLNPILSIQTENEEPMSDVKENNSTIHNEFKEEENPVEQPNSEIENKLTTILKEQLEAFKQPVTESAELEINQSPHHTIDYFESQGIKAEINPNSNDKLSTQLKKFTDWLKHMKRLNLEQENDLGTDPELENAIQGIAQNSNEAREIVTETMAEVLEKQGKKDKAIQLYIKLSFLNPDKSTYFAAKIQNLKGI